MSRFNLAACLVALSGIGGCATWFRFSVQEGGAPTAKIGAIVWTAAVVLFAGMHAIRWLFLFFLPTEWGEK